MYKTKTIFVFLLLVACIGIGDAKGVTYTSREAFVLDLVETDVAVAWELLAAETIIPASDRHRGVTFDYSLGSEEMRITDTFEQTTGEGSKSLGLSGPDVSFLSGDGFVMTFDIGTSFVGMYVIGSPGDIREGDLTLYFGGAEISNGPDPDAVLPDGGEAYFLGIIISDPPTETTEAILQSHDPDGSGLFVFNVDDIIHHGCVANLDEFGSVTLSDFARLAQNWLDYDCGLCEGADFTGDNKVRFEDLEVFVFDWLCGI